MEYKVESVDELSGVAFVRYWGAEYPIGLTLSVEVPISEAGDVDATEFEQRVLASIPTAQLAKLSTVAKADKNILRALVAPKSSEQIKEDRVKDIDKTKRDKLYGGFTYNGVSYHCDPVFQQQITSYVVGFESGITPADAAVPVRTYDNQNTSMTYAQLKPFATVLMAYVTQIYMTSWAAKDAL